DPGGAGRRCPARVYRPAQVPPARERLRVHQRLPGRRPRRQPQPPGEGGDRGRAMTGPKAARDSHRTWVRLDNAANIFLAARNEADTKVFRLAADLDDPIVPEVLQRALDHVYARYP